MDFIELTGQSCVGKTSFLSRKVLDGDDIELKAFKLGYKIEKIIIFFWGIIYLGLSKTVILLYWSFKEDANLIFRLNIFRNAVTKVGIFSTLMKKQSNTSSLLLVDEGLSHLPFLFLNTETPKVLSLISEELKNINVIFLKSPGSGVIKERLKSRGHQRLRFLSLNAFIRRNDEIEDILIKRYSDVYVSYQDATARAADTG
tara:strand:+ start:1191 stop:1793 length:603 start_codon:yes stop_codon:yes gene_type:complete